MDQEAILERVLSLSEQAELEARLTLATLVDHHLDSIDMDIVVVGGTAVDLYVSQGLGTSESYPPGWRESLDIDTIVLQAQGIASIANARDVLLEAGFKAPGASASFLIDEIPYPIDLVGNELPHDYSEDHLQPVRYEAWEKLGLEPIDLVGPEDLLFDYMESGVDTRHQRDWARALAIAQAMCKELDLGYLFTKAHWRREGSYVDALETLLKGNPLEA